MPDEVFRVSGNIVDALNSVIYAGTMVIKDGKIAAIEKEFVTYNTFIVPGLVDAHVHIESSMLVPAEFARLAAIHGTVAAVADPHEIANVLGVEGIDFMLENGKRQGFKFYFGAPSCVPSNRLETTGAAIGLKEVEELFARNEIKFLGEVMNFQGVVNGDIEVMSKLALAKQYGKRIDGHAPGLRGDDLSMYVDAGISTDHEVSDKEEGCDKIQKGMMIQIREGSAARNFNELVSLLRDHPSSCMFCSDDKHPYDLVKGHINEHVHGALDRGIDPFKVFRCASINPVKHYGLSVGLLQKGDPADFLVVDDLKNFNILKTYINGKLAAENGEPLLKSLPSTAPNNFNADPKAPSDFGVRASGGIANVILAMDGSLKTGKLRIFPHVKDGFVRADPQRDILKMVVVNRYYDAPPAVAFVKNFGFKKGAIASSVAHDSHNIICVGVSDEDIKRAVNLVIENAGGIAAACSEFMECLPLPVAGLMSGKDGFEVAKKYRQLDSLAKTLGTGMQAPFMTLSFMSLLVVPQLKLSNLGLIDTAKMEFTSLFEEQEMSAR
jgi:adenine deaminase